MTATLSVVADTDYGTDVMAVTDLASVWGLSTGALNVAYAFARRLGCPRGRLFYDENYGTDARAYVNRRITPATVPNLQTDISAEGEKDERIQQVTSDVTFNSQTRTLTISCALELITGETFTLVIAATAVNVTLLSVNGNPVSAAAPSLSITSQLLVGPAGTPGHDGAQGPPGPSGTGGTPQVFLDFDDQEGSDASGVEQVIAQKYVNFTPLPATLTAEIGALVYSTAGTGTFRLRIGGTDGVADGAIVDALTTSSNTQEAKTATNAAYTNPTGWQLVKLTAKSSAAGQTAGIASMTASFR